MHVDHPNIVKLYEVFEDENTYSLVMELMTGGEVIILLLNENSYSTLFLRKNILVKKKQLKLLDQS